MYTYSIMKKVLGLRNRVLKAARGRLEGFYLAGGTALSLYYFNHRESFDLDFFTRDFSKRKIGQLISGISEELKIKIDLASEQNSKDKVRILVYYAKAGREESLKMDFVEDVYDVIAEIKVMDGIPVLSKEDIYLRKINAACGTYEAEDIVGRAVFRGGRQEAKDFFDLYYLSKVFMPLSQFAAKECSVAQEESIILWYNNYDRVSIKAGLGDIITNQKIDYTEMDRHFKIEIEKIIKRKIG